ncbi:MAG: DUF192 domain-containing protein [Hyphomicrobiaceae bacterium]|nr:DUF192 domain-containing protein [Hyphomicrobiaceae bacterium]
MDAPVRDLRCASSRTVPGTVLLLLFWSILLGSALGLTACDRKPAPQASSDRLTFVTPNGSKEFTLEIADTDERKQLGLMFRTELKDGHGMLFLYDPPQEITMWMRNTYISLDMVFIGADGAVVHVARDTTPLSEDIISSEVPAKAVLEIAAGAAERYGIIPGVRVEHPYFGAGAAAKP